MIATDDKLSPLPRPATVATASIVTTSARHAGTSSQSSARAERVSAAAASKFVAGVPVLPTGISTTAVMTAVMIAAMIAVMTAGAARGALFPRGLQTALFSVAATGTASSVRTITTASSAAAASALAAGATDDSRIDAMTAATTGTSAAADLEGLVGSNAALKSAGVAVEAAVAWTMCGTLTTSSTATGLTTARRDAVAVAEVVVAVAAAGVVVVAVAVAVTTGRLQLTTLTSSLTSTRTRPQSKAEEPLPPQLRRPSETDEVRRGKREGVSAR